MIESFYDQTATVLRTTPSPTSTDAITTVTNALSCVIRPVSDMSKLYVASNTGKEYDLVCDDGVDINIGDEVVADKTYQVLGVSDYTDLEDDTDSHLDVRLVANE